MCPASFELGLCIYDEEQAILRSDWGEIDGQTAASDDTPEPLLDREETPEPDVCC